MKPSRHLSFFLFALLVGLSIPAFAMEKKQEREFHRVSIMALDELTEHAKAALTKRYPDEKWESHPFPGFVFTNESVEAAYKIAVKRPELLAKIRCYCPCEALGHKSLLHCFFKNGEPPIFDKHAVFCVTCYSEALLAFLWSETGATDDEIIEGMKKKYLREKTVPEGLMQP